MKCENFLTSEKSSDTKNSENGNKKVNCVGGVVVDGEGQSRHKMVMMMTRNGHQ